MILLNEFKEQFLNCSFFAQNSVKYTFYLDKLLFFIAIRQRMIKI